MSQKEVAFCWFNHKKVIKCKFFCYQFQLQSGTRTWRFYYKNEVFSCCYQVCDTMKREPV